MENFFKPWNWKVLRAKRYFETQHNEEIRGFFNEELYQQYLKAIQ